MSLGPSNTDLAHVTIYNAQQKGDAQITAG